MPGEGHLLSRTDPGGRSGTARIIAFVAVLLVWLTLVPALSASGEIPDPIGLRATSLNGLPAFESVEIDPSMFDVSKADLSASDSHMSFRDLRIDGGSAAVEMIFTTGTAGYASLFVQGVVQEGGVGDADVEAGTHRIWRSVGRSESEKNDLLIVEDDRAAVILMIHPKYQVSDADLSMIARGYRDRISSPAALPASGYRPRRSGSQIANILVIALAAGLVTAAGVMSRRRSGSHR